MKTKIVRSSERGKTNIDWLDSKHSFSFGHYHDPKRMNFGTLRVLNDDKIAAGKGFGTHQHDNMEIISYAIDGELAHKDSAGNGGVIGKHEIQVMSAGSGIYHSEFNNSKTKSAEFLQIWIDTKEQDIKPRYDQRKFDFKNAKDKFLLLVSGDKKENSLYIHQNAWISVAELSKGKEIKYGAKGKDTGIFIFLVKGEIKVGNDILKVRDSIEITDTDSLEINSNSDSEILLLEIPMS